MFRHVPGGRVSVVAGCVGGAVTYLVTVYVAHLDQPPLYPAVGAAFVAFGVLGGFSKYEFDQRRRQQEPGNKK